MLRKKIAFFNLLKWFLASTLIGVAVGVTNSLFLKALSFGSQAAVNIKYYYFALPAALYFVHYLAKRISPEETDISTNDAIKKINSKKPIGLISAVKAFVLPIITISAGGSAGKEAPCADVGAGVGSFFAKLFSFNANERRKLMICGVSAGFAGVFGVPISGALFGVEVLSVGKVFYEVMFPAFIAGITSYQVTHFMGVEYIYHNISFNTIAIDGSLVQVIAAGIFFGLISILFIEVLKVFKIMFRFIAFKTSVLVKCLIGGLLLIAIALLTDSVYLGLGMTEVDALLSGAKVSHNPGFLIKMATTAITFAAGGVGGIITPIFFIGASAGSFLAEITGLNSQTFAALGVVSVLAGAANTPLAASVMATELFGSQIAPYAAVSCIVSFLITGHRTVFSKQRFTFDKTLSDDIDDDGKSLPELKQTLHKKNFFLSAIKHLMPEVLQEEETKSSEIKVKEQQTKSDASHKTAKEKGNKNSLFAHLFPTAAKKEENNGPDKK